jgi:hypothetical protein
VSERKHAVDDVDFIAERLREIRQTSEIDPIDDAFVYRVLYKFLVKDADETDPEVIRLFQALDGIRESRGLNRGIKSYYDAVRNYRSIYHHE